MTILTDQSSYNLLRSPLILLEAPTLVQQIHPHRYVNQRTVFLTCRTIRINVLSTSQVVAAIADIELPANQWPQLIQTLLDNVTSSDNSLLRQASLVCIGFICETTNPEILKNQANDILTAVVQGARKEEENQEVRLAAVRALYNSLEFIRENFESEVWAELLEDFYFWM